MSSAERLGPCPWCGEVPNEDSYALRDGGYKYGGVVCGCGVQGPDVRTDYREWPAWKPAAIAAWNERRAPAEAGAPSGWQPIETAPRDGRPLLLFARSLRAQSPIRLVGWWIYGRGWIEAAFAPNHPTGVEPTHWMPLPEFPKD